MSKMHHGHFVGCRLLRSITTCYSPFWLVVCLIVHPSLTLFVFACYLSFTLFDPFKNPIHCPFVPLLPSEVLSSRSALATLASSGNVSSKQVRMDQQATSSSRLRAATSDNSTGSTTSSSSGGLNGGGRGIVVNEHMAMR
jgi:hypothetical protein